MHLCLLTSWHPLNPTQAPQRASPDLPRPACASFFKSQTPGVYILASCGSWISSLCIPREGVRYADTAGPIPNLLNQNLRFHKTARKPTSMGLSCGPSGLAPEPAPSQHSAELTGDTLLTERMPFIGSPEPMWHFLRCYPHNHPLPWTVLSS